MVFNCLQNKCYLDLMWGFLVCFFFLLLMREFSENQMRGMITVILWRVDGSQWRGQWSLVLVVRWGQFFHGNTWIMIVDTTTTLNVRDICKRIFLFITEPKHDLQFNYTEDQAFILINLQLLYLFMTLSTTNSYSAQPQEWGWSLISEATRPMIDEMRWKGDISAVVWSFFTELFQILWEKVITIKGFNKFIWRDQWF